MVNVKTYAASEGFSFQGWDIVHYLRGRKQMIITLAAGLITYLTTDNELATIIAAGVVEMVFALLQYYLKEY